MQRRIHSMIAWISVNAKTNESEVAAARTFNGPNWNGCRTETYANARRLSCTPVESRKIYLLKWRIDDGFCNMQMSTDNFTNRRHLWWTALIRPEIWNYVSGKYIEFSNDHLLVNRNDMQGLGQVADEWGNIDIPTSFNRLLSLFSLCPSGSAHWLCINVRNSYSHLPSTQQQDGQFQGTKPGRRTRSTKSKRLACSPQRNDSEESHLSSNQLIGNFLT